MKKYIGTKIIKARPMAQGEYSEYEDRPVETEKVDDPGFLVGYPNADGEFNGPLEGGCNYISWSPEDVFNASYRECVVLDIDLEDIPPHQIRVVEEKQQLDQKLKDLNGFAGTPFFLTLPPSEQASFMKAYSGILGERIENF